MDGVTVTDGRVLGRKHTSVQQPGVVGVVLDPAVSDIIGAADTPGVYTWNWRLE